MTRQRGWRVIAWRVGILVVLLAAWQTLTGIKAVSKTPGLYCIDPFLEALIAPCGLP